MISRTWRWTLGIVLAATVMVAAFGGAQTPPTPGPPLSVPDQAIAFFEKESPAILAGTIAGLIFKFFPKFRNVSNQWVPVIAAGAGWLVRVFTPELAHASFFGDLGHTVGGTAISFVDAALSKVFYEIFLRGPTAVHWTKPVPDVQVRATVTPS